MARTRIISTAQNMLRDIASALGSAWKYDETNNAIYRANATDPKACIFSITDNSLGTHLTPGWINGDTKHSINSSCSPTFIKGNDGTAYIDIYTAPGGSLAIGVSPNAPTGIILPHAYICATTYAKSDIPHDYPILDTNNSYGHYRSIPGVNSDKSMAGNMFFSSGVWADNASVMIQVPDSYSGAYYKDLFAIASMPTSTYGNIVGSGSQKFVKTIGGSYGARIYFRFE